MSFDYVLGQLESVKAEVAEAAISCGRNVDSVKLMAVSKTFPSEAIMAAYSAGQRVFGENKVQELEVKEPCCPSDIEWHLIGHLQSNKVVKAVALADYIHSVDSMKLLKRIERLAGEAGTFPNVLLEVNISGEESKFGLCSDEVEALVAEAIACKNLKLVGLMTMAPFGATEEELRFVFSSARKMRDYLEEKHSVSIPELSMGMSSDYRIAVEEGATIVRIGTSIFGKRDYA